MIQFSRVSTYNPVSFAIRTLKTLYRRVDLRKLEASINNSDSFELNAQHVFQNYIFDGNSLSNLQLETIGITRENIDTMELPEDVVQILKFNNGMLNLKPSLIDEYSTVKETIRTYGDFHKVRRYKFASPTFKADLGMKKLQITKVENIQQKQSECILAIDFSKSMTTHPSCKPFIKSVLLYFIGEFEKTTNLKLSLLIIVGKIYKQIDIKSADELVSVFSNLPEFILPTYDYESVFVDLNNKFPGKSVIFVTDGVAPLIKPFQLKVKLYTILLSQNPILHSMCLVSGGQSILLNGYNTT
jgi:hypothetical protein